MTQQVAYNRTLQDRFDSTRRVAPSAITGGAVASEPDPVARLKDLARLHAAGSLDDEEFRVAKAKVLGGDAGSA
jgi:hypothetical protein